MYIYIYSLEKIWNMWCKELSEISVTPLPKIIVFMVLLYISCVYRCICNIYKINHCIFYHCRFDIISVIIKYFVCQRLGISKQPIYSPSQTILEFLLWRHLMSGLYNNFRLLGVWVSKKSLNFLFLFLYLLNWLVDID